MREAINMHIIMRIVFLNAYKKEKMVDKLTCTHLDNARYQAL